MYMVYVCFVCTLVFLFCVHMLIVFVINGHFMCINIFGCILCLLRSTWGSSGCMCFYLYVTISLYRSSINVAMCNVMLTTFMCCGMLNFFTLLFFYMIVWIAIKMIFTNLRFVIDVICVSYISSIIVCNTNNIFWHVFIYNMTICLERLNTNATLGVWRLCTLYTCFVVNFLFFTIFVYWSGWFCFIFIYVIDNIDLTYYLSLF